MVNPDTERFFNRQKRTEIHMNETGMFRGGLGTESSGIEIQSMKRGKSRGVTREMFAL